MLSKVYYFLDDNDTPSWGVGIIYSHVTILNKHGVNAFIVHNTVGFKVSWFNHNAPIVYTSNLLINKLDTIVVPEFIASDERVRIYDCKKILFVQNLSLLFHNFPRHISHLELGFTEALIIMPHMKNPITKFTNLKTTTIRPYIADYFFSSSQIINNREKIILLYPKKHQFEYSLIKQILFNYLDNLEVSFISRVTQNNWRVKELVGLSHRQVSTLMKKSMFLITTNTFEAFNTSVPEAMASGCINICYEAFGPSDFLSNTNNSFVFPNNHAIELVEKTIELIQNFDQYERLFETIRFNGLSIASEYTLSKMENDLVTYFSSI